jgi:hypothetical protein
MAATNFIEPDGYGPDPPKEEQRVLIGNLSDGVRYPVTLKTIEPKEEKRPCEAILPDPEEFRRMTTKEEQRAPLPPLSNPSEPFASFIDVSSPRSPAGN